MPFPDDELVALLGRLPANVIPPEAARTEAAVVVKRAQNTERDRDAFAAFKCYREALDLDPTCKPAYEAMGRLLLAEDGLAKPSLEAAARYFEVAQKRLPAEAGIQELARKFRGLVSPAAAADAAVSKSTRPRSPNRSGSGKGSGEPQRTCEYCGSPIPLGADSCKSCQLSGEILQSDVRAAIRDKQKASSFMLFALFLAALIAVGGLAALIYVRLHK